MSSDRAVSDTLGFVLVFAMMVSSIALVGTVGLDSLGQIRDHEQLASAERAFDLFDDRLDAAATGSHPGVSQSLDLQSGSLRLDDGSSVTVEVDGSDPWDHTFGMHSLTYQSGETTIAYESGAVFRSQGGGTFVVSEPSFNCSDDIAVVSVVTLNATETTSVSGGTTTIEARQNRTALRYPSDRSAQSVTSVDVTISDASSASGWTNGLEATGWTKTGADTYTCTTNRVIVRETVFRVRFI